MHFFKKKFQSVKGKIRETVFRSTLALKTNWFPGIFALANASVASPWPTPHLGARHRSIHTVVMSQFVFLLLIASSTLPASPPAAANLRLYSEEAFLSGSSLTPLLHWITLDPTNRHLLQPISMGLAAHPQGFGVRLTNANKLNCFRDWDFVPHSVVGL